MSFGRSEEVQRTIAQSSPSFLRSNNNNNIYDDEHLQSKKMLSKTKTKTDKEDFSLLIRLKVRFGLHFLFSKNFLAKENYIIICFI
jgi:hypothetical protein